MATVDQLITDARSHATDAYDQAADLVGDAQDAINGLTFFQVFGDPNMPALQQVEIDTDVPEFTVPELTFPTAPTAPTSFENLPALDFGEMPDITAEAPTFTAPAVPAPLVDFTQAAPSITTAFTFPEPPGELASTIEAPVLGTYAVPTKPDLQLPVFEATPPGAAPEAPTNLRQELEAAYADVAPAMRSALGAELDAFLVKINPQYHVQLGTLETRLTTYIAGGTALPAAVEDAIHARARARTSAEARRTVDTAYADAAGRGFTMPPGTVQATVRAARAAGMDAAVRNASDIAIEQAKLEQQNIQFAMTLSKDIRATAMQASLSYHGNLVNLNGQAITYAQAVLNAMVQVYQLAVDAFRAKLDGYRAEAQVYETRLRGVQALIDVYRAELDALKILTDVDRSKVALYEARIGALRTLAEVYRTRVQTVVARADLEKLKIDLFGAQVQLYEVQGRAKASEFQAYGAALSGQEAQLRAYGEEVRAQGLRVDAHRAKVDAVRTQVAAVTDYNRGLVDRFTALTNAWGEQVRAQGTVAATTMDVNRVQLQTVQARLSAQETQAKVNLEYFKSNALTVLEQFKVQSQMLLENGKLGTLQLKSIADVALSGAKVYEGLASAALSGMNTLVQQNLTETAS